MKRAARDQQAEAELKLHYKNNLAQFANELPDLSMYSYPAMRDFMEPEHRDRYYASGKKLFSKLTLSAVCGLFLNIALTQINPKDFLRQSRSVRLALRLPLFVAPILLAQSVFAKPEFNAMSQIEREYNSRLRRFRITKDFGDMDPHGRIFAEYMQKMGPAI